MNLQEFEEIDIDHILQPADVLLLVPPLAGITLPAFGLHLLQASCRKTREQGITVKILYTNFLYAKLIGKELHSALAVDDKLLLGEQLFASSVFGKTTGTWEERKKRYVDSTWVPDHVWKVRPGNSVLEIPAPVTDYRDMLENLDLEQLEMSTTRWVQWLVRRILEGGNRIIGCSNTYSGLVPPLALLTALKQADPSIVTILGGALCEAEMAEGICSLGTGIDYIFSGEGEITFPELAAQILAGEMPGEKIVRGQVVEDLDAIPLPDFSEFAAQRESETSYAIVYESSRGCWYGKCTFCALNGKENFFRCKSPDRVIKDLAELNRRHPGSIVAMADNMMPNHYFEELIPRLAAEVPGLEMVYEMKADLALEQVMALKDAGVIFRPGIESLSPSLLKRIQKPGNIRRNIALLRYARMVAVNLEWAIIFAVPGDEAGDYREMLHLLPLLRHLPPPSRMVPMIIYRYSQYHRWPERFGISGLRPAGILREILPAQTGLAGLEKTAYYFSGEYPCGAHENPGLIAALGEEISAWQEAWSAFRLLPLETLLPTLHIISETPERFILEDTRGIPGQPGRRELDREQAHLLMEAQPVETLSSEDVRWAVDAKLATVLESWFIPLPTVEPGCLSEVLR